MSSPLKRRCVQVKSSAYSGSWPLTTSLSVTDDLVARNRFTSASVRSGPPAAPALKVAVVACMDARMDIHEILGLDNGDGHIIRNAGGIITDDVIRSLCLSQRALGTREIILLHHTKCGVCGVIEEEFRAELEAEYGVVPEVVLRRFQWIRTTTCAVRSNSSEPRLFVPHTDHVRGFVHDVDTGLIDPVD